MRMKLKGSRIRDIERNPTTMYFVSFTIQSIYRPFFQVDTAVLLQFDRKQIGRENSFEYLGSVLFENIDPDKKMKCRIETACTIFNKMNFFY